MSSPAGNLRPWWQLNGFTRTRGTDRFWAKLRKTRDPEACWQWLNGRSGSGYGVIRWQGKVVYAHVLAWTLYHGCAVPEGRVVRHLCGNQLCCRPSHLATGTPKDNSADMVAQGRWQSHVLNHGQVHQVRWLAAHGVRLVDIAGQFHISQRAIHKIVCHHSYKHVDELLLGALN